MQVGIGALTYVPTIFMRPAELTALEHLSETDKDKIIPIVLLKPWGNSSTIEKAVEKIEQVYSDRSYFLECDHYYDLNKSSAAAQQFYDLVDEETNHDAWWELVGNYQNAIPSVPLRNDAAAMKSNLARANDFGRGFLIRVRKLSGQLMPPLLEALHDIDHNEYVISLDVGWGRDILSSELWADGWIRGITAEFPDARIVVSGSSFPRSFTQYGIQGEEAALERVLFASLLRKHNLAKLIYGDWASSRSPVDSGGGVIIPRIDVPQTRSWFIFRAKDEFGNYKDTAEKSLASGRWAYDPDVWGKYVINNTAQGAGYVIDSAKKSTEVRINIHLHEQINIGLPPAGGAIEEDFID